MQIEVTKVSLNDILHLRTLFLHENNFQIRYNACHERGWTDSYAIIHNNVKIGYGAIKGKDELIDRDTVFEFYVIPPFRKLSSVAFLKVLQVSNAKYIECQSNDLLLSAQLYEHGEHINSAVILFEEHVTSEIKLDQVIFRKRNDTDIVFDHKAEPVGDFVLEHNNEVIATGGFLLHYNMPFADLYMEVSPNCRRQGFGSFLIQELKRKCYLAGRVPAARTGVNNVASRATLRKAGLKVAGFMLLATVRQPHQTRL